MNIKKFNKGLASFTIIELVVTMIISSIIVGICYYAYLLLNNQFTKYQTNSEALNEYYLFSYALQKDADRSNEINTVIDNRHLLFSNVDTTITYSFESNVITREMPGNRDTFRLKAVVDSLETVADLKLIKSVFIQTQIGSNNFHFIITKNYSSRQIMKAEQNENEQIN